jgi:formylmethanofuran dehydrogenase subunit C
LTLRLKEPLSERLDGSLLDPARMAGWSRQEIEQLSVGTGHRRRSLGEFFEVIGDPCSRVVLHGELALMDRLGARMTGGQLTVMGEVGDDCGLEMGGGMLEVFGKGGDHVAAGMKRGTLIIHGSVGDFLAGPGVGQTRGMRGGTCIVLGNAGHRVGERLRRGIVMIQGRCGDFGGVQMIAGTLAVFNGIGQHWGTGMRRGTIILTQPQPLAFDAELTPAREFELSFLPLLWKHLAQTVSDIQWRIPASRWAYRQLGDRANGGVGEVLVLSRRNSPASTFHRGFDLVKPD